MNPQNMIRDGIKNLIAGLKTYTARLPFDGMNVQTPARTREPADGENNMWKWPGAMRGYGPITRLYDWEKKEYKDEKEHAFRP